MKTTSIWFPKAGVTEHREVEVAPPGPREVQVRCLANGICLFDVSVYKGVEPWYPFQAGHEGVGEVIAVGAEVTHIKEGDRVPCRLWQGVSTMPADGLPVYRRRDLDPAFQLWEPVDCVVRALRAYDITPGDRVLMLGAGFMGLLNVQGLARYPLAELAVCDFKAENLALARDFGATETVPLGTVAGDARLAEMKATPYDLVIEASGAPAALAAAGDLTRTGGRLAIFGWHHGERTVNMTPWHMRGLRVLNTAPGIGADHHINTMVRAVALIDGGVFDLSRLITHRHCFAEVETALRVACERPAGYLKGVLVN